MSLGVCVLFADRTFGPTALSCVGLPLVLAGPFLLIAFGCRAIFRGTPTPVWQLVAYAALAAWVAYFLWPMSFPRNVSSLWVLWWLAAVVGLVSVPAVFGWEWVRRSRRR